MHPAWSFAPSVAKELAASFLKRRKDLGSDRVKSPQSLWQDEMGARSSSESCHRGRGRGSGTGEGHLPAHAATPTVALGLPRHCRHAGSSLNPGTESQKAFN